jgi:phage-related tail protein
MATADELKAYLTKRGFNVSVDATGATYQIVIHTKTADDIAKMLALINEPGRFIITSEMGDILPYVDKALNISKLGENLAKLEESMRGNMEKLTNTDSENKRQAEESISSLTNKFDSLEDKVKLLVEKMSYIEQQPWWKRFLGVK